MAHAKTEAGKCQACVWGAWLLWLGFPEYPARELRDRRLEVRQVSARWQPVEFELYSMCRKKPLKVFGEGSGGCFSCSSEGDLGSDIEMMLKLPSPDLQRLIGFGFLPTSMLEGGAHTVCQKALSLVFPSLEPLRLAGK